MSVEIYEELAGMLNSAMKLYNYQVNPSQPKGSPGRNDKSMRMFRMFLINKVKDTSDTAIPILEKTLKANKTIKNLKYNQISPNSSKFPSFTFDYSDLKIDVIVARGANKGENFEQSTIKNLDSFFKTRSGGSELASLMEKMNDANPEFAKSEILRAEKTPGTTLKEGVALEKLGRIISDISLIDNEGKEWYISLKDINGDTFSSYSGAASLFDKEGNLVPDSKGAEFLNSFGVDLNKVQAGFDERANTKIKRPKLPVKRPNQAEIKKIFERAWGINYFYVRRGVPDWKVFWLDRAKLNKLSERMVIKNVRYPSKSSKQITIVCSTSSQNYIIEIRNSKAGEYPNDTKFKVTR